MNTESKHCCGEILKHGYLRKKSGVLKKWKLGYFALGKDCLSCYHNEKEWEAPSQGAKILLTISSTFLAKLRLPDGAWLVKGVLACVNNSSLALHSLDNICKRCSTASLRVLKDSLFIQRQPQTKIRTTDRRDGRVEGNKSVKRHLEDCLGSSSKA